MNKTLKLILFSFVFSWFNFFNLELKGRDEPLGEVDSIMKDKNQPSLNLNLYKSDNKRIISTLNKHKKALFAILISVLLIYNNNYISNYYRPLFNSKYKKPKYKTNKNKVCLQHTEENKDSIINMGVYNEPAEVDEIKINLENGTECKESLIELSSEVPLESIEKEVCIKEPNAPSDSSSPKIGTAGDNDKFPSIGLCGGSCVRKRTNIPGSSSRPSRLEEDVFFNEFEIIDNYDGNGDE